MAERAQSVQRTCPNWVRAASMCLVLGAAATPAFGRQRTSPVRGGPPHEERLVVPTGPRDWSAYRLDTEVFGWKADFSEVAAVCMEVMRGPLGKHRGETYLLVYREGETLPKHNIICHSITHADLPHNPLPLQPATAYLWSIEPPFIDLWPVRPRRRRGPHDMAVKPLWAPLPAGASKAGTVDCVPWVALEMQRGKERRLMPYRPLDMSANCELLHLTDDRTYWGRSDVAASMVRFDFAGNKDNEESARFVVSAVWGQGAAVKARIVVPRGDALATSMAHRLQTALRPHVAVTPALSAPIRQRAPLVVDVQVSHDWLPLALVSLRESHVEVGRIDLIDGPYTPPEAAERPEGKQGDGTETKADSAFAHDRAASRPSPRAAEASRTADTNVRLDLLWRAEARGRATNPRFGEESVRGGVSGRPGSEPLDGLSLPPAAPGESALVDDITTQHDPIEDTFGEEGGAKAERRDAAAEAPLGRNLLVAGSLQASDVDPAGAAKRRSTRPLRQLDQPTPARPSSHSNLHVRMGMVGRASERNTIVFTIRPERPGSLPAPPDPGRPAEAARARAESPPSAEPDGARYLDTWAP